MAAWGIILHWQVLYINKRNSDELEGKNNMLRKTTVIIILLLTGCASSSSQRAWEDAETKTRLSCAVPVIGCLPNLFFSAGGLINKAVTSSKEQEAEADRSRAEQEEDKEQGWENGNPPADEAAALKVFSAEGTLAADAVPTETITDTAGNVAPKQQ